MIWIVGYAVTAFLLGFFLEFKTRTSDGWFKGISKLEELFFTEYSDEYKGLDEWAAFFMGALWPLAILNICCKSMGYICLEAVFGIEKLMNWVVSKHKNK